MSSSLLTRRIRSHRNRDRWFPPRRGGLFFAVWAIEKRDLGRRSGGSSGRSPSQELLDSRSGCDRDPGYFQPHRSANVRSSASWLCACRGRCQRIFAVLPRFPYQLADSPKLTTAASHVSQSCCAFHDLLRLTTAQEFRNLLLIRLFQQATIRWAWSKPPHQQLGRPEKSG